MIEHHDAITITKDVVGPQQNTLFDPLMAALNGSQSSSTSNSMPGSWSPAPMVEGPGDDDMPGVEEALAPQDSIFLTAASMPGSWPPAPTVEDCDEAPAVADDYDDMPGLEEPAATQQPMSSDTSAAAPSGPTSSNAQTNANTQPSPYPTPFSFPFMPANLGADADVNANTADQSMPTQFLASMLAQAFGPLAGFPAGTAPAQHSIPSATDPLASMADLVSALNGQHQTETEEDDEDDESEDDDGDMPTLEAASPSSMPNSTLHSQLATEVSQDEEDEWEDVDDDMPSLEVAPPLATPEQPAPHPGFPPIPLLHQNPFTAAITSFAQSLASNFQSSQSAPPGTASQSATGPHNEAAPNAVNSPSPAPAQGGSSTPSDLPLPFPFPGPFQVSMGTISTGGPNGVQITTTTIPMPEFAAGLQQAMASMSDADLEEAFTANFDFPGPLPPLSEIFNLTHPAFARGPPFNTTEFVDGLERVDIANIPEEDMRCPHCWLPFGTTDEDDPDFVFAPDRDEAPLNAERQVAFHEMPFCTARPDSDPVRTPCGHIFGRGCLIETLERVNTRCPTCRQEFRRQPEGSPGAV